MTEPTKDRFVQIKAFQCTLCGAIYEYEPPDLERAGCVYDNCPALRLSPEGETE